MKIDFYNFIKPYAGEHTLMGSHSVGYFRLAECLRRAA